MVDKFVATVIKLWAALRQVERLPWSRAWWWTLVVTPAVTLWSRALQDLHSDYLVFVLQTVNNPWQQLLSRGWYWPQWALAWSWDVEITARLNAFIRVGTLVYCLLWITRLVSHVLSINWWKICAAVVIFMAWWSRQWPEFGDSVMYSGSAAGAMPLLAVLGDPQGVDDRMRRWWFVPVLSITAFFSGSVWIIALLATGPLALCSVFLGNTSRSGPRGSGLRTWVRVRVFVILAIFAGGCAAALRLSRMSGEATGLTTFGLATKIQTTRHLWGTSLYLYDNLRISVVLLTLSLLLAWKVGKVSIGILAAGGFGISVSVIAIAAIEHVQNNFLMPRYFGLNFTLGLGLQVLTLIGACFVVLSQTKSIRLETVSKLTRFIPRSITLSLLIVFGITSTGVALEVPLGFGLDYGDQSGNSKKSTILTERTIRDLDGYRDFRRSAIVLNGNHWNLWSNVFVLQSVGIEALAMEGKQVLDLGQQALDEALSRREFFVLCVDQRISLCVSSTGFLLLDRGVVSFDVTPTAKLLTGRSRAVSLVKITRTTTSGLSGQKLSG